VEASRRGGMAEVATNVLHNVGNVLNSANISTNLVTDRVKKFQGLESGPGGGLAGATYARPWGFCDPGLQRQTSAFVPGPPLRGSYGRAAGIVSELDSLRLNIEHIKNIVAMQQNYATFGGVKEVLNVVTLVEDSLRMNELSLSRHRVEVVREFDPVPVHQRREAQNSANPGQPDAQRQLRPATSSGRADKRDDGARWPTGTAWSKSPSSTTGLEFRRKTLTRIFNHGFTTRKGGHGFGLHSGALAAREMGGSLTVHSDGPGQGAAFTLALPCTIAESSLD